MTFSCYDIELDILKTSSQLVLPIKRMESGRRIRARLMERRTPYRIGEGCYAVFAARKPDGNKVYNDCVIEDNTVVYTITPQTVAAVGNVNCEIKLYDRDGLLITSPTFVLLVDAAVYNEGDLTESAPEYLAFAKIVDEKLKALPESYTKEEIDAIMGAYITDIDNLLGGDA